MNADGVQFWCVPSAIYRRTSDGGKKRGPKLLPSDIAALTREQRLRLIVAALGLEAAYEQVAAHASESGLALTRYEWVELRGGDDDGE